MMKKSLLAISVAALTLGAAFSPLPSHAALPQAVSGQTMPSLAPMLEKVSPAVVSIAVEGNKVSKQRVPEAFRFFFGPNMPSEQVQERPFRGLGSGVIIDADKGYIVTNHHVIDDADQIRVQLQDGREYDARLIGSDEMSDIALLQLDDAAKNLTAIKLANSDALRVGDFAVAIGNPFGLGQTVTSGIISALGRSGLNLENFENFIQTDAAINSGNSGGALVNLNGELIGINTAILGPNGGNVGIGFAIPANMAKSLVDQILEYGSVRRGMLGVTGRELTSELADAFGLATKHGAFVSQVMPDSAAEEAGLKAGDIIVSVNGKSIRTFGELRAKIATLGAGKDVELGVIRDGETITAKTTLKEASQTQAKADDLHKALKGAELKNHDGDPAGVEVAAVAEGSLAARYGLREGDVIVGVNRHKVENLGDLRKILEDKPNVLALNIARDNGSLYLVIR
ncbi:serine endoprotease DegQ [Salinivibrio sp. IB574]|uniref:Do family serine endopeptidase n=2 Tax=Vibrionaceae TaxID=641 RepID=A0ABX6K170_SALCS|nr:serine endoprotease DegQ [Salinivibrio sp. DV]OOF20073.1 serine endoprotease DegQ [Salinivibrio sp. IB574]OOF26676.1 serine endoprotease DegQ [Salinivibrio sp. IB872]PCE68797.1 serine endoprotease DegQ [Salinivibrio sp. YCSC6]QIR05224.1 Do family serine endopeptidase [Salinivibrio costicola]